MNMEYILIGGAPSVGKSECIHRIAKFLLAEGFLDAQNLVPHKFKDFTAILEKTNESGEITRVVINSATDTTDIIYSFKNFCEENGQFNVLISSIRDGGFWPRNEFFEIMGIDRKSGNITEFPLAKITRRGDNFDKALKWYKEKTDRLIKSVLMNNSHLKIEKKPVGNIV